MNAHHLIGPAWDAHDASYVDGMNETGKHPYDMVTRGLLLRRNIVAHFPDMAKVFEALPELQPPY